MAIVSESRELASSLGALDTSVFFNDSWVDYAERQNYLTEADAGVSTHHAHIETTMSFRTRILDYLWAGLPMVVTEGDVFAELVDSRELGLVVRSDDAGHLAEALERILFDEEFIDRVRDNVARVREEFYWDRVLDPLVKFVENARHAADLASGSGSRDRRSTAGGRLRSGPRRKTGLLHNANRALFYLRNGGPLVVARKVLSRIRRSVSS